MNTNSNAYTIGYASIMVIIVAFLLAFVSSSLKDKQVENVKLDTKKQILSALNITDGDVASNYNDMVKDFVLNVDGTLTEQSADSFKVDYSKEIKEGKLHVFECNVNGEKKYLFPVRGAGLWGPIWGYVALNEDKNTVYGTYFGHEGETPGLGAEITKSFFSEQFKGKTVSKDGNVVLSVVKNGKVSDSSCEVDGISGGTITSKGVDAMLKESLSRYKSFLASASEVPACCAAKAEAVADSTVKCAAAAAKEAEANATAGKEGYGDFSVVEEKIQKVDSIKKEVKDELKK